MAAARFDVLGIGNAIVDVIARTEDDFLIGHNMRKGSMQLIDEAQAARIYDAMGPAVEVSGGSAANTIVGVAGLGARAAFIGKVKTVAQITAIIALLLYQPVIPGINTIWLCYHCVDDPIRRSAALPILPAVPGEPQTFRSGGI